MTLSGLTLYPIKSFADERGYFTERFREADLHDWGLRTVFVQDNFSHSKPGVLRGLHYQWDRPQGKLVTCTRGNIWDVVVDIRRESPTFGKWSVTELSASNPAWLWIPAGFAHSFLVLGEEPADVWYKVDSPYNPKGEAGIRWDDPDLAIPWPLRTPIVSAKDRELPRFQDYAKDPKF